MTKMTQRLRRVVRNLRKLTLFGMCGACGTLLGALVGEFGLRYSQPAPQPPPAAPEPKVDVMFVLDVTASMDQEIDGVRKGIEDFLFEFSSRDLDARVGLIGFGDRYVGEEPQVLMFAGGVFTKDTERFREEVFKLEASGGGDPPESCLDALVLASRQPFRPDATKVLFLITDGAPHVPDKETETLEQAAGVLGDAEIAQLHLAVPENVVEVLSPLQKAASGEVHLLGKTTEERVNFNLRLPEVAQQAAEAVRLRSPIQAGTDYAPRQIGWLMVATGLWTGAVAMGACLSLIIGQNRYLRRKTLRSLHELLAAIGSFAVGTGTGAVGVAAAGSFAALSAITGLSVRAAENITVWVILGALLGAALSLFVPNLRRSRALVGGAVGGAAGAMAFTWAQTMSGELGSRLVGATILGFSVGLMVAVVELVSREAWLEIAYGPKEIRFVGLGAQPVTIGSDKGCTVFAAGARPVALRYWFDKGVILCEDAYSRQQRRIYPGDRRKVANISITACAAGSALSSTAVATSGFTLALSSGRSIALSLGTTLTLEDIPGLPAASAGEIVAEVNRNPKDASILGLKNLSRRTWKVTKANGEKRKVPHGRSIQLEVGMDIDFGPLKGGVR